MKEQPKPNLKICCLQEHVSKIQSFTEQQTMAIQGRLSKAILYVRNIINAKYSKKHSNFIQLANLSNLIDAKQQNEKEISVFVKKNQIHGYEVIVKTVMQMNNQLKLQNYVEVVISLPPLFENFKQIQLQPLGFKIKSERSAHINTENHIKTFNKQNIAHFSNELTHFLKNVNKNKDFSRLNCLPAICSLEIELIVKVVAIPFNLLMNVEQQTNPLINFQSFEWNFIDNFQGFEDLLTEAKNKVLSKRNCPENLISFFPEKLSNPHEYMKIGLKEKHVVYLAKGIYEYYHYGDQQFNDQGWGCAYRALQTLISWFNLQNYITIASIPTIKQLQVIIDSINYSSQQKIANTREWIGATEVSWVIKKLTNFDCRIVHIADGKDIIEHSEIFREHFQKLGCPIMYGGGEYAYSIVGMNYSWKLGECEFLILDPHYNGSDSMDKIVERKGVSWRKPEEMFKKGIFYNFCLPLV